MSRIFSFALLAFIISFNSSLNSQVNLNQGLVAKFLFNNNYNDGSNSGNYVEISGSSFGEDRFENAKSSLLLNGNGELLAISNTFDFIPKTINLWFNASDTLYYPYQAIWQSDNPGLVYGNSGIAIKNINGKCALLMTISAITDTFYFMPQTWINVGISVDTNKIIRFYINGDSVNQKTFTEFKASGNGFDKTFIGASRNGYDNYFTGRIDDITVYNRCLSGDEMNELFSSSPCFEKVQVYDTVHISVYDTIHIPVYDSIHVTMVDTSYVTFTRIISVTDTLIFNAVMTGSANEIITNIIKVYPNPAKNHLHIDNGDYNRMGGCRISIVNTKSQLVFNSEINTSSFDIDVTKWGGKGLYLIYLLDSNGKVIEMHKIVLQ